MTNDNSPPQGESALLVSRNPVSEGARRLISAQEWRFASLITAIVLVLISLPLLFGYLSSPPDKQFMGLIEDVPDHTQYLSWWRGFESAPLISNTMTPEPNRPIFFNLLWWSLAQVSRWTGLGYALIYQAFRWLAGISFLWAVYRLLTQLLPDTHARRTAFLLVTFASGFGWVLVVLKYTLTRGELLFPMDVYISDGNSFHCLLAHPHLAFAAAFIALIFESIWRGWHERRTAYMVRAGTLTLLLGWMHGYDLVIIYGVTGAFILALWLRDRSIPWRLVWGGVIIVLLSCSGAIYSFALTSFDPLWKEILAQFANAGVYTPSPPHLVVLFGIPLIAAVLTVVGLFRSRQLSRFRRLSRENVSRFRRLSRENVSRFRQLSRENDGNLFLVTWFLAGAGLSYIPTDFQIHMLNSWQIPMAILATKGLYDFAGPALVKRYPNMGRKVYHWLAVACVIAILPTNIYLWAWRFVDLARHGYPYYLHRDEVAALNWLDSGEGPKGVVLSSLTIGQYIPSQTGHRAFIAHWAMTRDYYTKRRLVSAFFGGEMSSEEALDLLAQYDVQFVFYGPAEKLLGEDEPAHLDFLEEAFRNTQVTIYRVKPEVSAAARYQCARLPGSGGLRNSRWPARSGVRW